MTHTQHAGSLCPFMQNAIETWSTTHTLYATRIYWPWPTRKDINTHWLLTGMTMTLALDAIARL